MDDAAIWRKHKEELIRYATVLIGVDQADDVLSTVVERILRKGSLSDLDDARRYLFRAVLNESRGRIRRRRVVPWERDFVEDHSADRHVLLGRVPGLGCCP